jgi:hypothetical protein
LGGGAGSGAGSAGSGAVTAIAGGVGALGAGAAGRRGVAVLVAAPDRTAAGGLDAAAGGSVAVPIDGPWGGWGASASLAGSDAEGLAAVPGCVVAGVDGAALDGGAVAPSPGVDAPGVDAPGVSAR